MQQDDAITEAQLLTSHKTLERRAFGYDSAVNDSEHRIYAARIAAAVKSYLTLGDEAVRVSDAQRSGLAVYRDEFDAINALVKSALNHSFKMFGRVFAKPDMVKLGNDLDDMRVHIVGFRLVSAPGKSSTNALAASEARFSADWHANAAALAQSQGQVWVAQMRDALAKLAANRSALLGFEKRRWRLLNDFSRTRAALAVLVVANVPIFSAYAPRRAALHAAATAGDAAAVAASLAPRDGRYHTIFVSLKTSLYLLAILICMGIVWTIVAPLRQILRLTATIASGDLTIRVPGSGLREFDALAASLNRLTGQLGRARQVTIEYQQRLESTVNERTRQLKELAERDPLTQLPNRRQLFADLNEALSEASRNGRLVGLFFLDLDDFKNINDTMGHEFGDRVLIEISRRLSAVAQPFGVAARLGGDEFTVMYRDAAGVDELHVAGREILRALQTPLVIDNREVAISVSVGASIFPDHEHQADALLRAADAALLCAKALGRSQLAFFTPDLLKERSAKLATEQQLRRAVEEGEFELVFQPEVNAETHKIDLVEALLRWRLPDGSYAVPADFLRVAEESSLIINIGDWVLRAVIETASTWHHGAWPEVRVAMNVSSRQLADARFVDRVRDLLKEYRLPPRCIEIELTETVMQTGPATIESLRRLRAHGIAIALDDFGTGYSSIASLEQLPLSRIKLDRTLVDGIDSSPRCAAIARAIIGMCQGLGLEITAEGVERREQLALLINYRCMFVQGFLLSQPVSRDDLIPLLQSHHLSMTPLFESLRHAPRRVLPKDRASIMRTA